MSEEIKNNEVSEEVDEERVVVFEEALEAILFAAGHPISYATIAKALNMTPAKVKDKVFEYSLKYNDPEIPRGVIMLTFPDSCQLCTKEHYLPEIREALGIRKSGSLSTSSIEVLAIVAYNQPVTRAFVDTLRRVDSSYAMNNLLDRGLIVSKGRLDVPGRPMLYGTTSDFLRCFGLPDLDALPKTSDELIQTFENTKNAEAAENEAKIKEQEEKAIEEEEIVGGEQISANEDIDAMIDENSEKVALEEENVPEFESREESQLLEELAENADDDFIED